MYKRGGRTPGRLLLRVIDKFNKYHMHCIFGCLVFFDFFVTNFNEHAI